MMAPPSPRIRTEVEVAAEAIMALFATGLVGTGAQRLVRVSEVTSIPMDELRAAWQRNERRGYRPPMLRTTAPGPAPAIGDVVSPMPSRFQAANRVRVERKNPTPTTRRCSRCGEAKDRSEFGIKNRRTGQLKSMCRPCMSEYQRDRYVAVADSGLVASASAIRLDASSPFVGDPCTHCGHSLAAGDDVRIADVDLCHTTCGGRQ